jgi:hypothetical protein
MSSHYKDILTQLKEECSSVERYYGQTVYKISKDGFVYLRYSSGDKSGKRKYFFGLDKDAIGLMKNYEFSVIFVCGSGENSFIINKDYMLSIIDSVPVRGNQWKVNIHKKNNVWELKVTGKEGLDVTDFKNRFDLIFSRVFYIEREITKEEFLKEKPKSEAIMLSEAERTKSKLISCSTKSTKPSLFEEAIASCLELLGLECRHIGGAGNTDVLINKPYRIIVEAKSTSRDNIDKIYFTRLKQHKLKHEANSIVVVSNGFAPSVIRDAEIENVLLMPTRLMCKIIDVHEEYPLSPYDLEYVFQRNGLLRDEDLHRLTNKFLSVREKMNNLLLVVKSVDNTKRNLDELYGRYQIRCEESDVGYLAKDEFTAFVNFLAMPFLGLMVKENDLYCRKTSEKAAVRRLNKLGGTLCETTTLKMSTL